jgi:hypothetical protein
MNDSQTIPEMLNFIQMTYQYDPSVIDNLNLDKTFQRFGDSLGVPADIMRTEEEIMMIREQRMLQQQALAEQQQQQQQMEQVGQASQAAKNVGSIDPQRLEQIISTVSGA